MRADQHSTAQSLALGVRFSRSDCPGIWPAGLHARRSGKCCDDDHLHDTAVRLLEATGAGREPGKLRTMAVLCRALEASAPPDLASIAVSVPSCAATGAGHGMDSPRGGSTCSRRSSWRVALACTGWRGISDSWSGCLPAVQRLPVGVRYDTVEATPAKLKCPGAAQPWQNQFRALLFALLPYQALAGRAGAAAAFAGSPCRILARRSGDSRLVRARDRGDWNGLLPAAERRGRSADPTARWCPPTLSARYRLDCLGLRARLFESAVNQRGAFARPQRQLALKCDSPTRIAAARDPSPG